jgi:hypothetical protein
MPKNYAIGAFRMTTFVQVISTLFLYCLLKPTKKKKKKKNMLKEISVINFSDD